MAAEPYHHSCRITLFKQWQPVASYGPLRELGEQPTPMQIFETICQLRRAKLPQPELLGNAGSFFKNPTVSSELAVRLTSQYPGMPQYPQPDGEVKLAAGWLIEQVGLKGLIMGQAQLCMPSRLWCWSIGAGPRPTRSWPWRAMFALRCRRSLPLSWFLRCGSSARRVKSCWMQGAECAI